MGRGKSPDERCRPYGHGNDVPQTPSNKHTDPETLDVRVGRILNDFLDRRERGESISESDLLAQNADIANELRQHLALIQDLEPSRNRIAKLITQGLLEPPDDGDHLAQLGPYRITAIIGQGGMGIVLKAYEPSLKRTIALKLLRPELARDDVALNRFKREAQAAAALHHPNIMTVHAVGEEDGTHYIAMEYIEGPSLAEIIQEQGPLPTEAIRDIFTQLMQGLSAAHQAGLIHRDIKPSNLLLTACPKPSRVSSEGAMDKRSRDQRRSLPVSGWPTVPEDEARTPTHQPTPTIKIADFGLARMITSQTQMTLPDSILGTPEYMSPEQARSDTNIDHRTDLYSAGVVLYEMLTGRTPFKAETPSAVIHQILHVESPHPKSFASNADKALSSIALRLMSKIPEWRYDSAAELLADVNAGKRVRVRSPVRIRRTLLATTSVVVLVTLIAVGQFLQPNPPRLPTQVDVSLDEHGESTTTIMARFGDALDWKRFYDFPPVVGRITGAAVVDSDGDAHADLVAAITDQPWNNGQLFAIDSNASARSLGPVSFASHISWPDCDTVAEPWSLGCLAVANVDRQPGDELLIIANDRREYPTRLMVFNPRTEIVQADFWHTGRLQEVQVIDDYFSKNHPALLAWGVNNKLDGFYTPRPDDPPMRTVWDKVSVMMILDPDNMGGLGPPNTGRIPISPVIPFAYAFLDRPAGMRETPPGGGKPEPHGLASCKIAFIRSVDRIPQPSGRDTPQFSVEVRGSDSTCVQRLVLDLHLNFVRIESADNRRPLEDVEWPAAWRTIIQKGQYTDQ